jgi:putative FmdB family regulatory protein
MPTYDYVCDNCGHGFEKFQNMSEKPLSKCPECGGKLRRLIGPGVGIIFKGSGFYETDYKRKNTVPGCACRGRNKTCGLG